VRNIAKKHDRGYKNILNEFDEILKEESIDSETANISFKYIVRKVMDNRVEKFKENGGKVNKKAIKNLLDEFIAELFDLPVEKVKSLSK